MLDRRLPQCHYGGALLGQLINGDTTVGSAIEPKQVLLLPILAVRIGHLDS